MSNFKDTLEQKLSTFESRWRDTLDIFKASEDVSYDAAMTLFYGDDISSYIYDSGNASDDFINYYYDELRKSEHLQKNICGFNIIELYIMFKSLGYEVTSFYRDMTLEYGKDYSGGTYLDIGIRDGAANIEFLVQSSGNFYISSGNICGTIGKKIPFKDFYDLIEKIGLYFNLLMLKDHDFSKIYDKMQEDGLLYEDEDDNFKQESAALKEQNDYIERQNNLTKAIVNAAAFIENKQIPYPEI